MSPRLKEADLDWISSLSIDFFGKKYALMHVFVSVKKTSCCF